MQTTLNLVTEKREGQSQLSWIQEMLETTGSISRNQCLRNYISRLAARIEQLRASGLNIQGVKDGSDYRYFIQK